MPPDVAVMSTAIQAVTLPRARRQALDLSFRSRPFNFRSLSFHVPLASEGGPEWASILDPALRAALRDVGRAALSVGRLNGAVIDVLIDRVESMPPAWEQTCREQAGAFVAACDRLLTWARSARPVGACPGCASGAPACPICDGAGWMTEEHLNALVRACEVLP